MGTPGIEVRPLKTMTGHAEFNETFFTDVRVPMHHIVGQRGQGWFVANATLGHERGMLGDPDALENRLQALIRSEEHTSELQSLMRISYAVFCLKKKHKKNEQNECTRTATTNQKQKNKSKN